ncbi:MAG: (2Fe-2S)-binding protein [Thermomicrobiales bacterium]
MTGEHPGGKTARYPPRLRVVARGWLPIMLPVVSRNPPAVEAPLAQTLARQRRRNPALRVHPGAPQEIGGASMAAIVAGDPPLLDAHLAAMAAHYETEDREVVARFFLSGVTWHLARAAVGACAREQRVPLLPPPALGVACNAAGFPLALSLASEGFACLPQDPAAQHPAAVVVADEAALMACLRTELVSAVQPLIFALRQRARLGERALWIAAAEACAAALVEGLPPGTPSAVAQARVDALLGDPASPLRAHPELVETTGQFGLLGHDCCAMYRLPGQPYCATCPHRPRADRLAALQAWLAATAG